MVQKMHQHLINTMLNTYTQPKDQEKMQKSCFYIGLEFPGFSFHY